MEEPQFNVGDMIRRREQQREQLRQRLRLRAQQQQPTIDEGDGGPQDSSIHPFQNIPLPTVQSAVIPHRLESNMNSNHEDEELCRVCRSGREVNRPLFFPCRCNGSIKYIHQDCLITWLSHSGKEFCELCKTRYTFTPVYAEDTPSRLPFSELVAGGLFRMAQWAGMFVRLIMVLFVWIIIIPTLTAWTVRLYLGSFTTFRDLYDLVTAISLRTTVVDTFFGLLLCAIMILLSLALGSLLEYVQLYMIETGRVAPVDPAALDQGEGNIVHFLEEILHLINAPIQINEDEDIEIIFGYSGPLTDLFWRAFYALRCTAGFLGIILLLPKTLGTLFSSALTQLPLWFPDHFSPLSIVDNSTNGNGNEAVNIILGYVLLASLSCLWALLAYACSEKRDARNSAISHLAGTLAMFSKATVLLSVEAIVFPLMCGFAMDLFVHDLLHDDGDPVTSAWNFFEAYPILSLVLHYLMGLFYMLYFGQLIRIMREVFREGTLWFFRTTNDPDVDPLREVMEHSVLRHSWRISLTAMLYIFILLLVVKAPSFLCRTFLPSFGTFSLSWASDGIGIPIAFSISQILLPLISDRHRSFNVVKNVLNVWVRVFSKIFDLESFLLPPPAERPREEEVTIVKPNFFKFRLTLFVLCGFVSMSIISLCTIVIPTSIGRLTSYQLSEPSLNDFYCFTIGVILLWLSATLCRVLFNSLNREGQGFNAMLRYLIVGCKWMVFLFFMFFVIPLLFGILLESAVIIPLATQLHESVNRSYNMDWSLGVGTLKLSYALIMFEGVNDRWKEKIERLKRDGVMGLDLSRAMKEIVLPIMIPLLYLLTVPYLVGHIVAPFIASSVETQIWFTRYIYLIFLAIATTSFIFLIMITFVPRFYQSIYDDRYLVGHRLHNFQTIERPPAPAITMEAVQDDDHVRDEE
ncbi:hypothetical protein PROFUN_06941 [Planoprotostelium fungivorum]|uniref:RING-type E3 ubiquitin transferase n=1 Tax=Planoprotostelium fungivorum TaxID=1890364 RepID=A0A2P6NN68_9EUKA|nr:hypothetical protein PROFUN_06941 [Planoprotostelium fungivorum]